MPDGRPACGPCKLKKKRCVHRLEETDPTTESQQEAPTPKGHGRGADTNSKEDDSPIPADSTDELSPVPSDVEEKPVTKKRVKRGRPFNPITPNPLPELPDLPDDPMEAASALSVHKVFARELQTRLQEFDMNFRASQQAHRATMTSAKALKRAVDGWMEAWTSGL